MNPAPARAHTIITSPPEPGQLVEVRRRPWIVADVDAAAPAPGLPEQHLVKLSSIDEDALGEELEALWELEPGAHVIEHAGLPSPTSWDAPERLDTFLDAVRWGAATNVDRGYLQAPFRSGISIEDYQLDPLVRAIDMARTNLLIADDVGLGKTIEAGLVVQELLLRHRIRTILVLCPASLQEKWRTEMGEKFGLDFQIVNTSTLKILRRERGVQANPWTAFPRLIASIDWAKQGEGLRLFRDALPAHPTFPRRFDLLIVDEAHNVAPKVGRYAVESLRTRLVRLLAPQFQHKLFLTATPHDGYTESFTALLELLDDQRFARNVLPAEDQLARVMVRRLKGDLVDSKGRRIYPVRRLEALRVEYSDEERRMQRLLDDFIASREATAGSGKGGSHFVHQLLKKRMSSSPAAFASTFAKNVATIETGRRPHTKQARLDERILRRAIARTEEDYADDEARERAEQQAVEEVSCHLQPLSAAEQPMVEELRSWAQRASHRPDAKAKALLAWLEEHIRPGGRWTDTRVILFTEYRTTQSWLHEILASHGYGGERLALIYGGMDSDDREDIKAAFQADPKESPVRILLATDAASEGIDLQNHCNLMVHVEIPYNPNVMEQRNGRIDRHGQKQSEVVIWHPVDSAGSRGDDIIRALRKLDAMRADMGSVNPVIAPQLPALLEGRRRELDTRAAEARMARARRFVKVERELRERIAKLHERLTTTRQEQHLAPERVERAVRTALVLAGQPDLVPTTLSGVPEGALFRMPPLTGSWSRCLEGIEHPYSGRLRPITFDHAVARGRDDVVLVHLQHRLLQMSLRLLRAEVWARDDVKQLHRITVRTLSDDILEGPALVVVSRLVVTGGDHHRLHEELTEAGGYLQAKSFLREAGVRAVRRWLDDSIPAEVPDHLFAALKTRFEKHRSTILAGVEARSKERLKYLVNTIARRAEREIADVQSVLTDLEENLRSELAKEMEPEQLSLFSEDERTQLKRDRAAIEARLARIPEERDREVQAIRTRHDSPKAHTFPVAVVFLVPKAQTEIGRTP